MSAAPELTMAAGGFAPASGTSGAAALDAPTASALFDAVAGELPSITLDEVAGVAQLHSRTDAKYLVAPDRLAALVEAAAPGLRALQVGGRLGTSYETVYFDTPDLAAYRAHLQRRRRRYKVRTRTYDGVTTVLEVKAKDARGRTDKHRTAHPGSAVDQLGVAGTVFVEAALQRSYGFGAPAGLTARASTTFSRLTLVDPEAGERITIDHGLRGRLDGRDVAFSSPLLLVEVKAATWRGRGHRTLRQLGIRPRSFSKYCLTVGACSTGLPNNPWLPVLRALSPQPSTEG